MVLSLFQSLAILVVLRVYALAEPQTYVILNHYNDVLTLPPGLTYINTVSPVTKPIQKNIEGDPKKDSRINMNASNPNNNFPQTTPTLSYDSSSENVPELASNSEQPNPSAEASNADTKASKSRLAPSSRRVKKTSVTVAPNKVEEPVTRPRAMTLPR